MPSSLNAGTVTLGLRENWRQFSLLVLINAFVGATIGLERTVLPLLAEAEFGIVANSVVLSFRRRGADGRTLCLPSRPPRSCQLFCPRDRAPIRHSILQGLARIHRRPKTRRPTPGLRSDRWRPNSLQLCNPPPVERGSKNEQ